MTYRIPEPTPETAYFWEQAGKNRLVIPFCRDTNKFFFYPRSFSPFTGSRNVEWREVSGEATLHSYIINHRPFPGRSVESPVIALVKLREGPILMSNIVDVPADPEHLQLDMELRVKFVERGDVSLPMFAPERG